MGPAIEDLELRGGANENCIFRLQYMSKSIRNFWKILSKYIKISIYIFQYIGENFHECFEGFYKYIVENVYENSEGLHLFQHGDAPTYSTLSVLCVAVSTATRRAKGSRAISV